MSVRVNSSPLNFCGSELEFDTVGGVEPFKGSTGILDRKEHRFAEILRLAQDDDGGDGRKRRIASAFENTRGRPRSFDFRSDDSKKG